MVEVVLDETEMEWASLAGAVQRGFSMGAGYQARYGHKGDPWSIQLEGVRAEMAVAKYLDVYWRPSLGRQRNGERDVASFEVRSRKRADGGLILHRQDPDEAVFILVVPAPPVFRLVGWIRAKEGKREEWWGDPYGYGRPAFFVPQPMLVPVEWLR